MLADFIEVASPRKPRGLALTENNKTVVRSWHHARKAPPNRRAVPAGTRVALNGLPPAPDAKRRYHVGAGMAPSHFLSSLLRPCSGCRSSRNHQGPVGTPENQERTLRGGVPFFALGRYYGRNNAKQFHFSPPVFRHCEEPAGDEAGYSTAPCEAISFNLRLLLCGSQ